MYLYVLTLDSYFDQLTHESLTTCIHELTMILMHVLYDMHFTYLNIYKLVPLSVDE